MDEIIPQRDATSSPLLDVQQKSDVLSARLARSNGQSVSRVNVTIWQTYCTIDKPCCPMVSGLIFFRIGSYLIWYDLIAGHSLSQMTQFSASMRDRSTNVKRRSIFTSTAYNGTRFIGVLLRIHITAFNLGRPAGQLGEVRSRSAFTRVILKCSAYFSATLHGLHDLWIGLIYNTRIN